MTAAAPGGRPAPPAPTAPVVLLTDFGEDYYVGVLKGVVARLAPRSPILDLTHRIRPGAVEEAAFVLESSYAHFPAEAVFCCVVDPGVGGARRRIAVRTAEGRRFVAPDNGLLSPILNGGAVNGVFEIVRARGGGEEESATFQGRSDFAPAAARLAGGAEPAALGPPVADPNVLPSAPVAIARGSATGAVRYVDVFGNLVTTLSAAHLAAAFGDGFSGGALVFDALDRTIRGLSRTYADVAPGAALAYVGSTGHLEIAVRDGSAAAAWHMQVGDVVRARTRDARI